VHLDVAGPAFLERGGDYSPKGATGVPARMVLEYILSHSSSGARRR